MNQSMCLCGLLHALATSTAPGTCQDRPGYNQQSEFETNQNREALVLGSCGNQASAKATDARVLGSLQQGLRGLLTDPAFLDSHPKRHRTSDDAHGAGVLGRMWQRASPSRCS